MWDLLGCSQCACLWHRCWYRQRTRHNAICISIIHLSSLTWSHASKDLWLLKFDQELHGPQTGLTQMWRGRCRITSANSSRRPSDVIRSPWFSPNRLAWPPNCETWDVSLLWSLQNTSRRSMEAAGFGLMMAAVWLSSFSIFRTKP